MRRGCPQDRGSRKDIERFDKRKNFILYRNYLKKHKKTEITCFFGKIFEFRIEQNQKIVKRDYLCLS